MGAGDADTDWQTQGKACIAGVGLEVTEGTHNIIHYTSF